jgi:hypothetical protein
MFGGSVLLSKSDFKRMTYLFVEVSGEGLEQLKMVLC